MNRKKWLYCGAGLVLLAVLFLAGCAKVRENSADDLLPENSEDTENIEDGAVTIKKGEDEPKVIESSQIRVFSCEVSLLDVWEPGELGNHVYAFEAERQSEKVVCTYTWFDGENDDPEEISFETDAAFLDSLQNLADSYHLAEHNGFYHSVSGLPYKYGAVLHIEYESGETIYASDNQDNFLPLELVSDLRTLFGEVSGKITGAAAEQQDDDSFPEE